MSVACCIVPCNQVLLVPASSKGRSHKAIMPVVSPRRFSSTTSSVSSSSTGSYRPTLINNTSSLDRPYYSSTTGSYITARSSSYLSRSTDNKRSYSRHSSISEDSGFCSRTISRNERSESREPTNRRDSSLSRNDSQSSSTFSSRSREPSLSITGRRISSIALANSVDDIRQKYSPSNYVPNIRKPETKSDISRSKSISNDIGRPPLENKANVEARSSLTRKNKVTKSSISDVAPNSNSLSVSTNANVNRKTDGASIEKIPKTSLTDNGLKSTESVNSSWPEGLSAIDDDNGNMTQSVSEIRKKFNTPSVGKLTAIIPNFLKNPNSGKYEITQVSKTNELSVSCQNLKLSNKSNNSQNNGNNVRWTFLSNSNDACESTDVEKSPSVVLSKDSSGGTGVQLGNPKPSCNHTTNFASYIPVNICETKPVGDTTQADPASERVAAETTAASPGEPNSATIGDLDMSRDYSRRPSTSRGYVPPDPRYMRTNDISTSPRLNRTSLTPSNGNSPANDRSLPNRSSLDRERHREEKSYERPFGTQPIRNLGLNGLRNIGNTCFMNSVIQCLSNTRFLLEYLRQDTYLGDINNTTSGMKGALVKAFSAVIQELWSGESDKIVNTSALKSQIQRFAPRFMGYAQQDAQEFLRYLLEGLHEDVNRVTIKPTPISTEIDDKLSDAQKAAEAWSRYLRMDDSAIVDIFVGQLKSTLQCTVCGHASVTFDPFWDLSLPLAASSITQCLEHFTREETLDGHEKPTCAKCQTRRKCTKSFSIQKFPKILVLHLKRFSPMERFRGKLTTVVDFPLQSLDLSAFAANRGGSSMYNLYAISNHSGTTYSGHYTAYCKHPYSAEWHEYNDSRVSSISAKNVISSEAYVLFYELSGHSSHL